MEQKESENLFKQAMNENGIQKEEKCKKIKKMIINSDFEQNNPVGSKILKKLKVTTKIL